MDPEYSHDLDLGAALLEQLGATHPPCLGHPHGVLPAAVG